jgi:putative transposase
MPRPVRSFARGGFYHVTSRGNDGCEIVVDDEDRADFVRLLARIAVRFRIRIHAWCLMTNHYHLVLETPGGQVSQALHYLNGIYARRFNERYGRSGHLFGGRFRATVLDSEEHFEAACRYALSNPVRAGLVASAGDWPWAGAPGAVGADS